MVNTLPTIHSAGLGVKDSPMGGAYGAEPPREHTAYYGGLQSHDPQRKTGCPHEASHDPQRRAGDYVKAI